MLLSNDSFLTQFENCSLPKEHFKHINHLRLAWLYLSKLPLEEAMQRISEGIIRYATSIGAAHIYHVTLTRFWICMVHAAMRDSLDSFEAFINAHSYLLDKKPASAILFSRPFRQRACTVTMASTEFKTTTMLTISKKRIQRYLFMVAAAFLLGCFFLFWPTPPALISLFPLEHYNQNIDAWIEPQDPHYTQTVLSPLMQEWHWRVFNDRFWGKFSPWNADYIHSIIHQPPPDSLEIIEQKLISYFSNRDKPTLALGYGENFRAYSPAWIDALAYNIHSAQLHHLNYQPDRRAIAIDNLSARILPTEDAFFYNHTLAGEGYPFDHLQISAIWAGTPLYILAETRDHAWSLVVTPDIIGWVKTTGLAIVSEDFVNRWLAAAKQGLVAISRSATPIIDQEGQFRFSAYVGSIFPGEKKGSQFVIRLPVADSQRKAVIQVAQLSATQAELMPVKASPQQFSKFITALIGRPYGWGGLYFYNDCSAELKNLLTPFGIWLPRHSSDQVFAGKIVDLSHAAPEQRLSYTIKNSPPFLTLIYVGGHILLYLGKHPDPKTQIPLALSYQNFWELSPNPPKRRAVIGKAALFPLLLQYPEDRRLISQVGRKYFQLAYLDQTPSFPHRLESVDLKTMMSLGS